MPPLPEGTRYAVAGVTVHQSAGSPLTDRSKLSTTSDWLRIRPRIVTDCPGSTVTDTTPSAAPSSVGRRSIRAAAPGGASPEPGSPGVDLPSPGGAPPQPLLGAT